MDEPRRKPHKRYLFYRAYCLAAMLAWNATGLLGLFGQLEFQRCLTHLMLAMVPLFLPALFMAMSLAVFPFRFSIFGAYERTPLPAERPTYRRSLSHGGVWWFRASVPFVTWTVFPSGLGISILGIGTAFLPAEQITELKQGLFSRVLRHTSPELRNPVYMPGRRLAREVTAILPPTLWHLYS
jgi:hypothetical protein